MFKAAQKQIAKNVPVTIKAPSDEGRFVTNTMRLDFEILSKKQFEAFSDDDDLLLTIIKGWADGEFCDENGVPHPFSEENVRRLIDYTYVRTAIVETYVRTAFGDQGRRKNS